jgi:hypothetical protein
MLCFEIAVNGTVVCVAGSPIEQRLSIDVYRGRNEIDANLFVAGDSYSEKIWSERLIWGNQRLAVGDEVLIKVIYADQPDAPIETHRINVNQEGEKLTDLIVKQVAAQWLDHLLRGQQVPFPPVDGAATPEKAGTDDLYCSFCGKVSHEVKKLISGPGKVFICNECVGLCVEILETPRSAPTDDDSVPPPGARWPKR